MNPITRMTGIVMKGPEDQRSGLKIISCRGIWKRWMEITARCIRIIWDAAGVWTIILAVL